MAAVAGGMASSTRVSERSPVVVDLGCGGRKVDGAVGVDIAAIPGVDVVADIERGLPLRDCSVDAFHAYHVLEHVDDFLATMTEIWRALRDGGRLYVRSPHAASTYTTWKDPTHRRGLTLATFTYFDDTYFDGAAFSYYSPARFRIEYARLGFSEKGAPVPMPVRDSALPPSEPHGVVVARRVLGRLFHAMANGSRQAQYACERFWGPVVGIEEVTLVLRAIK
jgi:SAM-dependent methyltransferase